VHRYKHIVTLVFVSGMMLRRCGADITNTALNQSVVFIKVADAALTNDFWKVVVKVQLTPYEKAAKSVKTDLAAVTDLAHPTPLIEEVYQIQTFVNTLEGTRTNLKRYLPKLIGKAVCSIFKVLF